MIVTCEERYREALAYAEKTRDTTLYECLERLKRWETAMDGEVSLQWALAPLPFYFEITGNNGRRIMNGGVLYHAPPR